MISPGFIFKCVGRQIFSTNPSFRLLVPSPNSSILYTSLGGLKSQEAIIHLPEKPKRPLNGFFRYVQERKLILLKEHPEWKPKEIVKKCSEDWKTAHPTVKQKYGREYRKDLDAYAQKYLEYTSSLTDEQKEQITKISQERRSSLKHRRAKQELKMLNKPKRPPSAFTLYLFDQAKIRNVKYNELIREIKGEWELLDPKKKLEYEEKYKQSKSAYEKELEEWEMKMIQEGNLKYVRKTTLEVKRPSTFKKLEKEEKSAKKSSDNKKSVTGDKKIQE